MPLGSRIIVVADWGGISNFTGSRPSSTLCTFPTVTAALGQANFLHVKEWYAQYGISNSPRAGRGI